MDVPLLHDRECAVEAGADEEVRGVCVGSARGGEAEERGEAVYSPISTSSVGQAALAGRRGDGGEVARVGEVSRRSIGERALSVRCP